VDNTETKRDEMAGTRVASRLTDLSTDSSSVPIFVDRVRFRSNERSVTDLAVIHTVVCFI